MYRSDNNLPNCAAKPILPPPVLVPSSPVKHRYAALDKILFVKVYQAAACVNKPPPVEAAMHGVNLTWVTQDWAVIDTVGINVITSPMVDAKKME